MDTTILASIIGAAATASAAVTSATVTVYISHKKSRANKPIANFAHAQRDYTRTHRMIEKLLSGFVNTDKKPDLFITNFGTPISILKNCKGFSDYHTFLISLTQNAKCVVHRYFVMTKEKDLRRHIQDIKDRSIGHTDANIHCCDNTPFGTVGDTIINFLALSDVFGAVTFETRSKVILSLHTTNPHEVAALVEVIRSIEPYCKKILANGQKREAF